MFTNPQHLNAEHLSCPSIERWHALCRELDRLDDRALLVAMGWLEVRLRGWPARLRPAPLRWTMDALRGKAQPRLALAGTLVLSPSMISRPDWAKKLASAESLSGIEQVWVDGVSVDAWDLGVLARASWVRRLSVLCLTRCSLQSAQARALGALLAKAPLTHLSLAGNALDDHCLSLALSQAVHHRLMYLDLRGSGATPALKETLSKVMPQLHALVT